jgi:hypothetical protein
LTGVAGLLPMDDAQIFRFANVLMAAHGRGATAFATQRARNLMRKGDSDGAAMWLRIVDAMRELAASAGAAHH